MSLDRTGQQIAHRYGPLIRCMIARCGCGELGYIKSRMAGASHYEVNGVAYRMGTTSKGIALWLAWDDGPELLLKWTDLTRHVNALPEALRAEARELDYIAHRPPHIDPENGPPGEWHERVTEGTRRILDAAFPLAVDREPTDLLEVLATL